MNYKGKYVKSRTCKHALEYMMSLVVVKDSCPQKHVFNATNEFFTTKEICVDCEHYEKGEDVKAWGKAVEK